MSEQSLRILLATHQATLRERLATYLRCECDYYVETAATGEEMLTQVNTAQGQYDVALIDGLLTPQLGREPKPSGLKLMAEIRRRYSNIQCILFTGQDAVSGLDALRAGAYHYIRQPFAPEELTILIERATEYRRLKDAAREKQTLERLLELLRQTSALISAAPDFDSIVRITLKRGLQAIGTNEGSILLVNSTNNELEMKAWIVQGEFMPPKHHRNFANGEGIAGHVALTGTAYNCPDCQRDPHFVASFTGRNPRSLLSVPIISYGRVLGMINADSQELSFFTSDDVQFLSALSDHLAFVIESQRLRNFGMIVSTLTLDEMLAKIVESACMLTGTELGTLYLIDPQSGGLVQAKEFPTSREVRDGPRKQGGLTRLVIDTGESIAIADVQRDRRVRQSVKDEGVRSLIGVPLKIRGEHDDQAQVKTIGVLFVDTMQQREFSRRDMELLQSLASQAAIAIEKARLYEEVTRERDRSGWMASQLFALHEITKQMQSELDLPSLLNLISRLAAELLKADAAGILLLDAEKRHLTFKGSYHLGAQIVEGTRDLVGGSIAGRVVKTGQPIIANDIPNDLRFYNPAADGEGLLAVISTPLWIGRTMIGTLDAHSKTERFAFDEDDLQILSLMANQAAIAIENTRLFQQTSHRAQALEALYRTSLEITSRRQVPQLVQSILERAVELLQTKGGALYMLDESEQRVRLVAVSNLPEQIIDMTLEVGDSVVRQIITTRKPSNVSDYRNWSQRLWRYDEYNFTAVAGAPIAWQGNVWGVLVIHDDVAGRSFSQEEVNLLSHFGNWAAVAIENAELAERDADKLNRLERLSQASGVIMGNLATMSLNERLNLIAQQTTEILHAEACGILLVNRPGFLRLEASYGHREGSVEIGKELAIRSGPRAGLTGHIAATGGVFNKHGSDLTSHFAVAGEAAYPVSEHCHSLLAIPLTTRSGGEEQLIGLLRADNKRDRNGHADPSIGFTREDEWILRLIADVAVVALEDAGLVTQLSEQKKHLERLIASSPNGVIAIDLHGKVTVFSAQAQEALGYQLDEVLSTSVDRLYDDPQEPNRIGALLHAAPDGKLANYETIIRSKEGERIPIRMAATWLYNAHEQPIGSVGYFEDLRAIKETEQHLALLLKASNIVTQAENLTDGLQSLAAMMVTLLNATLCRIFLLGGGQQFLISKAAHPVARASDSLDWSLAVGERTAVAEWPHLSTWLARGRPRVLRAGDPRSQPLLAGWSHRLGLGQDFQSLLIIPLKTHERIVGLLTLGELRDWKRAPLSADKRALAVAIANQTAILIDRMRLHEITERRRQLLAALDETGRHIRAELETSKLSQKIAHYAARLLNCTAAALYVNRPHLGELELSATYELSDTLIGSRQSHTEGIAGLVARTSKSRIIYEYANWLDRERMLAPYDLKTAIAVPLLRQVGDVTGVLLVADSTGVQQLSETDLDILERFAMQAAQALHTSRLMNREQRMFSQLHMLHHISDYIQAAYNIDKILHVVLTGITAGYGLGFNRAALLLLDERREYLVGQMGIGQMTNPEAQADWTEHHERGLEDFGRYVEQLEQNSLPLTPVGERIRALRLPVRSPDADIFWQVTADRHYLLVSQDELARLPRAFITALEPVSPLIVVPLTARNQEIGFLVADNKFTHASITREDVESLLAFANTAALVIDNTRLHIETKAAQERLRSFYEASNALVASQNPERVLQDTVERARAAANASGVSAILIDEWGQARRLTTAGTDKPDDITEMSRTEGLSMQVMRTGIVEVIEDTNEHRDRVNPGWFQRGVAAALGLPISIDGERIGIMWFHYDKPRPFSSSEIEAIQLYVNQAAIAYDSARRIEALSKARNAARVVAEVTVLEDLQGTLHSVVEGTKTALSCDAVILYIYDPNKESLLYPPIMIGVRYPERAFLLLDVPKHSIVFEMLKRDELYIVDNITANPLFQDRRFAKDEEVASCVAIPLRVKNETVGVMFVNYRSQHRLTSDEITNIELFAHQAAVAILNAQLYERMHKRAGALEALYRAGHAVTSSLDLDRILAAIAEQAYKLTGAYGKMARYCHLALVKDRTLEFIAAYPPEYLSKIQHKLGIIDLDRSEPIGITGRTVKSGQSQLIGNVAQHPDYLQYDDETRAELAVPIELGSEVIGVINVEHPEHNAFDKEDQRALEALAAQAAIAIQNARLYVQVQQRADQFQILYDAGLKLASELSVEAVLQAVVNRARQLTGAQYGALGVLDSEDKIRPFIVSGLEPDMKKRIGPHPHGRGVLKLLLHGPAPIRERDIRRHPSFQGYSSEHPETVSFLGVPIRYKGMRIGNLYMANKLGAAEFSQEDQNILELLAAQAAIAIENARRFEDLKRIKGYIGSQTAVNWIRMVSTAWGHGIRREVGTARGHVALLRSLLVIEESAPPINQELEQLDNVIRGIGDIPITAPLSYDDAVDSVKINELVKIYLDRQWKHARYNQVKLRYNLYKDLDKLVTIRASREWLRRALEILVDNAVQAMLDADCQEKTLTATTQQREGMVEISISDTGPGIAKELLEKLFKQPIEKPIGSRGAGIGLMLAQTIVQTYGGDMYPVSAEGRGTSMVIMLPIEDNTMTASF